MHIGSPHHLSYVLDWTTAERLETTLIPQNSKHRLANQRLETIDRSMPSKCLQALLVLSMPCLVIKGHVPKLKTSEKKKKKKGIPNTLRLTLIIPETCP